LAEKLEEGLRQVEEGLRRLNQPSVIVVNQQVPVPTSPSWHSEVDAGAVATVAGVLGVVLLVAAGFLLRRFWPDTWKKVKVRALEALRLVALPASWLCSKAATLLERFHHSSASAAGTTTPAAVIQV